MILERAPDKPFVHDNPLHEVVNDEVVELAPMGAYEVHLASILGGEVRAFAHANKLGRGEIEMLFDMGIEGRQRRPDVSFVSFERWPADKQVPRTSAWKVVPELAVEVASPSNTGEDVLLKVAEYFQAGVVRVWVVWPSVEQVYVYDSPTRVTIVPLAAALDGAPVLPGFALPLASLFQS